MKVKLISFAIVLICLLSVVAGGLLSVHRSEGRILTPEMQEQLEDFVEQIFPEAAQ